MEKFMPDGFQECSQMNIVRRNERSSYGLIKWTGDMGVIGLVQRQEKWLICSDNCVEK
jgi:hypothetical protein